MQPTERIWHDGRLIPWAEATVHVMAHGLHYGSSVFEGIRAYDTPHKGTAIFRLTPHIRRLYDSAKIYRMRIPHDEAALRDACKQVVTANGLASAYIRPLVYRGAGRMGLVAAPEDPVGVSIIAVEWGAYLGEQGLTDGVDVCVSSWRRLAPDTMPTMAKAGGNYLSSQLIAAEARRLGFTEGIGLDVQGLLSEGAGENLFLIRDGIISTTPAAGSILCGITRDAVMTLARELGHEVREQALPREMLYTADEVFMTGTAAEVTPVRSVDALPVGRGTRGPITERIQAAFFGLFSGETEDKWGWLEPVEE